MGVKKDDKDIIKVTCSIERIRYYKNEWGIFEASVDRVKSGTPQIDFNGHILVKGTMPQVREGNMYNIVAEYVNDPKWGDQYELVAIYSALDYAETDNVAQKKFLSSIFTPLQVTNMYEALDNPFEALKNNDLTELVKVKNCGMKTAVLWTNRFKDNISMALIFTELEQYNLTNNMVNRLMERYKSPELVVSKVKNNPYVLCNEIKGIGWKTADKIALAGGMDPYCNTRVGAYILFYLNKSGENGCSWVTPDELMGALIEEFGEDIPDDAITNSIYELEDKLWWNKNKSKIGLKKFFNIEHMIAEQLIRIRDAENIISYSNWEDTIKRLESKQGWEYTEEQKAGIKTALDNNVVVIQGLAGTGKSTLVSAMIEVLKKYSYVQCALSGRASSRMAEITGKEGFTIHRLLGYPHGEKQGFEYHDDNPLPYDIYILDEISMVDAELFYYLLRAIPSGSKLICLGDPGQLESIGSGNIAYDMIHSGEIEIVQLTQIHRQAAASAIITESIRVRHGEQIVPQEWAGTEIRGELKDLCLEGYSDKSNTFYKVMEFFNRAMAEKDFDILETQVIVPLKTNGVACTYEINNAIQEIYNPESKNKKEITAFTNGKPYLLREGDKVINIVNNYKTNPPIYNGNIGILKEFTTMYNEAKDVYDDVMIIDFMGIGRVAVSKNDWNNIELGYAISVHKSQGSQWDKVIFGIDYTSFALLTRELVYTGITRAKKKCDLIFQTGALRMAVSKQGINKKQTHLQECLYDVTHPSLVF